MTRKKKPDPEMIDDENPEWTPEMLRNARPAMEVFTELWGSKKAEALVYKGRGRPQKPVRKVSLTMRLDPDIVATFRASGRGWQSRINAALREWLSTH